MPQPVHTLGRLAGKAGRRTRHAVGTFRRLRARDKPRGLRPPRRLGSYHLLSADPVVLYAMNWTFTQVDPPIMPVLDAVADRPVHVFFSPGWHVGAGTPMASLQRLLADVGSRYPRLRVVVAAPTRLSCSAFEAAGLEAIHVNQNAFVDESRFGVEREERIYDAVYTARLAAFKRLELVRRIPRPALICNSGPELLATPYGRRTRRLLGHATWVCDGPDGNRRLGPGEISRVLNQAGAGLALSAVEGPMYASIEYLLSGLPVVTTPAPGGRHEFFDPAVAITVDPHPESVARGVREVIAARMDPHMIRRLTLERVMEHRARFISSVQEVFDEAEAGRDFAAEWPAVFIPKLFPPSVSGTEAIDQYNQELIQRLTQRGFTVA